MGLLDPIGSDLKGVTSLIVCCGIVVFVVVEYVVGL